MNKPLALFDVDKTLFDGFSYFPLLEMQVKEGLVDTSVSQEAAASLGQYTNGQLAYEGFVKSLLDMYAIGLKGRPVGEVLDTTEAFFNQTGDFFGYVRPTVDDLRASHELGIVTGGTQFSAEAVGKVFGIETTLSSVMGVENEHLTGNMASYLATTQEKREAIHHLTEVHPYGGSMGFGDSEGDTEMLRAIEHAVCIQPTPGLRGIAVQEGWAIVDSPDELASTTGLWVVKHALVVD